MFSCRVIPGNERAIAAVQDELVRRGVRLMTDDGPSGPRLRPSGAGRAAHGCTGWCGRATPCRCMANGATSRRTRRWRRRLGATPILIEDGDVLEPRAGPAGGGGQRAGRPARAGRQPAGADERRACCRRGGGCCSTAWCWPASRWTRPGGCCGEPRVSAPGPVRAGRSRRRRGSPPSSAGDRRPAGPLRRDDAALADAARAALRRALGRRLQKRPMVDVHLLRV